MFKASLTFLVIFTGVVVVPAAADPAASAAAQTELAAAIHGYQAALLHRGQAPLALGRLGVPEDWTHHHLVFSAPQAGSKVLDEPRYWQQRVHRALNAARAESATAPPMALAKRKTNKGLWEYNLGAGAAVGAGMYPAKFSFGVSSATCDSYTSAVPTHTIGDFVVYNTGGEDTGASIGAQGSATQPTIVGMSNLYSSCPTASNPAGRFPVVAWAYNTGSAFAATSPVLSLDGTKVAFVESGTASGATLRILKPFAPTTGSQGYYGHTTSANVKVTSGSSTITSTSNDFAVEDVTQTISCGTGIPSGSATINGYTSPTQITMSKTANATSTETCTLGTANTWAVGTIDLPALASWSSCTAAKSCMISVAFSGTNVVDLYSAPFYDYGTDTLYAGDSTGHLHKFTPVFNGTPAEITTSPWPVQPVAGVASSPVYDSNTGNIYMGDHSGTESATPVGCATTNCFKTLTGGNGKISYSAATDGIFDPPLVDGANKTAVWFPAGTSTSGTCSSTLRAISGVDQTLSASPPTMTFNQTISFCGNGARASFAGAARSGTFDNEYINTSVSAGHVWFCGLVTGSNYHWGLYNIGFNTAPPKMNSVVANGPLDMTSASISPNECTPVTEFLNTNNSTATQDEFYVGLQQNGTLTGCTGATNSVSCLYFLTSSNTDSTFPGNATAGLATANGTVGNFSGIIIDNLVPPGTTTGAAQVYFTPLADQACITSGGTGGCAYQASQGSLN